LKVARSKIEALEDYLVFRSREDYAGLWVFVRTVAEELVLDEGSEAVRDTTLRVIRNLLEAELVRPCSLNHKGDFEPWPLNPEQALDEISREWDDLDREPRLGDIVWFDVTEKGEKYVADYSPEDSGLAVEEVE
jgi:hypothetical protein